MSSHGMYYRACAWCVLAGLVLALPAIWSIVELVTRPHVTRQSAQEELPRWVYLLLFIGLSHVVYAVYVVQLRHAGALSVVAVVAVLFAAAFAMAAGWIMFGGATASIGAWLELRGRSPNGAGWASPAVLWCLLAMALEMALSVWANDRAHLCKSQAHMGY